MKSPLVIAFCLALFPLFAIAGPQALEISESNVDQLPDGKEADGIIGDYVLRNDLVEAVISCDAPLRRANMSTFYGPDGITPGCLYDLTLRGAKNDQLTYYCPTSHKGPVSHVRIVKDGSDGEAIVESFISASTGGGLMRRHEYRLKDGWQGILIVTHVRNEGAKPKEVALSDAAGRFSVASDMHGVRWADAVDPADKAGYAYAMVEHDGIALPEKTKIELAPGEEVRWARFVAVGTSPADALGEVLSWRGETGTLKGTLSAPDGVPVASGRVVLTAKTRKVAIYPDAKGAFEVSLKPGEYTATAEDIGRTSISRAVKIEAGGNSTLDVELDAAAAIAFDIKDDKGASIPCKAQFLGINGTAPVNLGPDNRAYGCKDQYHSEKGTFRVQVPPGTYRVVVTRGPEFGHHAVEVTVEKGSTVRVSAALKRLVDTSGWVSADFHNHSTPSGDNTCGTDDRIINIAAEQIEFNPTTEHNRLYDWTPHIEKLGLTEEIATVPGIELTGRGAHFNMFPLQPEPRRQDGGAPVWTRDPRINAVTLRDFQGRTSQRWVQINHPDMVENFIDRNGDGRADGGYMHLSSLINGVETQNYRASEILGGAPYTIGKAPGGGVGRSIKYVREFIWLQLLNQGHRIWGVAVADAHRVHGNGVGGWRTYLPSSTDEPAKIDWKEMVTNAQAGRMVLSTGPFLEVTAGDGVIAGGETSASDAIGLDVRVQCTDWINIDRIQVLVNGRQVPSLNFTRESHPEWFIDDVVVFDRRIEVPLSEDSHLIVVATGENSDLSTGFGTSAQGKIRPIAYNNPIFVDVDGDGFQANGDTLGYDLPVKQISVEKAIKAREANGLSN